LIIVVDAIEIPLILWWCLYLFADKLDTYPGLWHPHQLQLMVTW